ncbi:NTP pyrophosphohydrolase including oxidative damage repair enzyme [Paramagnetospirillum magneticum AMB-1]|uniref:NTP pyrophosphohydrolase including oxidative damage repair enzyme n=1 Tax=Paramagnetospirillum magneticum (strain ATCC 700264 / AMB-1) TaxID=342108 RepID=Q2VZL2_PARM1|nr:CoA pyrophosphatase [Paramagnetospirillum magneticum]BAE52963.1 NTP pyrophosphohydrolase including oxidative damage repair enzyme [Paramagnetospirillum magneticum AMB-1]
MIARRLTDGFDPGGRSDSALEAMVQGGAVRPGTATTDDSLTPAAVLVPLVERAEGLTVMLTKRTAHLAHHPGQISFPGGRLEPEDQGDFATCALRETEEETGLSRHLVRLLGRLDDYATGTGFIITPLVGVIDPPFTLAPDSFEVAEVFEVPLAFVLDQANHQLQSREVRGFQRPFWALTWEDRLIWGATAGILVNLSEVLVPRETGRTSE